MSAFSKNLSAAFEAYNGKRYGDAEAACRTMLRTAPKDGQVCFLMGMVLHRAGRNQEAVHWLSQAAEVQPESGDVLRGLGCAYSAMGDQPRAAESFARSIQLNPENPDAYYSMGNACQRMGQLEKAISLYRKAVELNPQDYQSWNNLGKTFKDLNRLGDAIAAYERSLRIRPDFALTHGNLALALLAAGRLEEGFREYEWRWCINGKKAASRPYLQPEWHGEPIRQQTLFVHAEQGFGDMVQFVRFVPLARDLGARVILESPPQLLRLLQYSGCADAVIGVGESLPPFDYYVPMMSLPRVLRATLETIPNQTPYLALPPADPALDAPEGHLKLGLAWAGSPGHHDDAARSIPLEHLLPILDIPGITVFSLQVPMPTRDQPWVRSHPGLVDLAAQLSDFYDTAAVIAQLDLVISVDTAVAHLAGALGKPVWTFVPHSPDWRWLLDRSETPWYPSMRLFRQTQRGSWQTAIELVTEELRRVSCLATSGRVSSH
jgi:tetratricopeptide (TPR) repeat protein